MNQKHHFEEKKKKKKPMERESGVLFPHKIDCILIWEYGLNLV